ncbi:MAG: helix-turn-helix domain-containing protein [Christensenellaceae bacterium]
MRNYVYNAIVYINEHYREELSLQSVAEAVGCSYNYLSKAFFEEVGIRFSQYVNNYRMQKAVYLLLNGETSVTDIAYETGFSSVRNFNRIFLAAMGTSPTEFRKKESPEVYNL